MTTDTPPGSPGTATGAPNPLDVPSGATTDQPSAVATVYICDECNTWTDNPHRSRAHYIARGHTERIEMITL